MKNFTLLFLFGLITFCECFAQIPQNGLVAWWPFTGNAIDSANGLSNGTVTGATLTTDRFGKSNAAYSFDGNGDYIDCGNHAITLSSTKTINYWFKYSDTTQVGIMFENANSLSGEWGASSIVHKNVGVQFAIASGNNNKVIFHRTSTSRRYADDCWHMFTGIYNSKTNDILVYIDTKYSGTKSGYGSSGDFNSNDSCRYTSIDHWTWGAASQYFSSTNNNGPSFFKGSLDDGRMYNRVLNTTEINALFNEGKSGFMNSAKDVTLCSGDSAILQAPANASPYLWQNNTTTQSLTVHQPGKYWVDYSNNSCPQTDTFQVKLKTKSTYNLGRDTTVCENDSIQLNVSGTYSKLTWNDGSSAPKKTIKQAGIYSISVIDSACTYYDTIQIDYQDLPTIDLGKDAILCEFDSVKLSVSGNFTKYLWQDGSNINSHTVTYPGKYWITVWENACFNSDTINFSLQKAPLVSLGRDTAFCETDSVLLTPAGTSGTYQWQDGSQTSNIWVKQPGSYWVKVTQNGCSKSDTIRVTVMIPPIQPDLGFDVDTCIGKTIILFANPPTQDKFTWFDKSKSATKTITKSGNYWIIYANNCGAKSDSVVINFKDCNSEILMPSSFSPNGDDLNELFGPMLNDVDPHDYTFEIYNLWGEMLFQKTIVKQKWDGMYLDKPVHTGVYVWIVTVKNESGSYKKSGTLHITR